MAARASQNSTIVRIQTVAVRSAFEALEAVSPRLGARWAERVWFTIPPTARHALEPSRSVGGAPFEVDLMGHPVRGQRWGDGPVIYLVHGWGGNAAQLEPLVPPLVAAGFSVVAHDAPGHGQSGAGTSGERSSTIVEFGRALDAVAAEFGPAHAVVAHSMGAAATALALEHGWLGTERLVLLAPMVDVESFLPVFQHQVGFGPRTRRHLDQRLVRRVGMALQDVDIARVGAHLDRPQLLVVHDVADRETPHRAAEELVRGWPHARLMSTRGLGHRRILRRPEVLAAVTQFVTRGRDEELAATA